MGLENFIAKNQYRFHYNLLSTTEKKAYDILLKGFFRLDKNIKVQISRTKVQKVYDAICRDVPELFFVKDIAVRYFVYEKDSCRIIPNYRFDEERIRGIFLEMDYKIRPLLHKVAHMSELEKEKEIHDYIVRNVTYTDKDKAYSHEVPGMILYGIAVCEGISKAFKFIADRVGLNAVMVCGSSSSGYPPADCTQAPLNNNNHAWNAVEVNDRWYHVDVTFDAALSNKVVRYDYFNLSDKEISVHHKYEAAPSCPYEMNYYRSLGYFAESAKELRRIFENHFTTDKPMVFQLPKMEGLDMDRLSAVLQEQILDSVWYRCFDRYTVSLNCNMERMVFQTQLEHE